MSFGDKVFVHGFEGEVIRVSGDKVYKSGVVDGKGFSKPTWKLIMDNCLKLGDK